MREGSAYGCASVDEKMQKSPHGQPYIDRSCILYVSFNTYYPTLHSTNVLLGGWLFKRAALALIPLSCQRTHPVFHNPHASSRPGLMGDGPAHFHRSRPVQDGQPLLPGQAENARQKRCPAPNARRHTPYKYIYTQPIHLQPTTTYDFLPQRPVVPLFLASSINREKAPYSSLTVPSSTHRSIVLLANL